MKKIIVISLLLTFGCIQKTTEAPDDLLSKAEMARVMTEIHILEGKIYKLYLKEDSAKVLYNHYEQLLLDSLGVSNEKFEASLEFYFSENIKGFQKVYEEVVDTLLSRQKRAKD